MQLTELLSPDRVAIRHLSAASAGEGYSKETFDPDFDKSKALSLLATLLASGVDLPRDEVQRVLLEREALQTTGIGKGFAIPHGALPELDRQCASLLIIPEGIDFAAIDGLKVQIVLGLIGPKRASGEHLRTLVRVSRLFNDRAFRERLIQVNDGPTAFNMIATEERERG